MPDLRWGLIGTARVNRRLIPAMRAAARSRIVAVASRDQARAEAYAREWSLPHGVAGYEALLRRDDIDAVYVPLPLSVVAPIVPASPAPLMPSALVVDGTLRVSKWKDGTLSARGMA